MFTQRLNVQQRTGGHVYQGRYKAKVIDPQDPAYFRSVATYIHLNPVAAGVIRKGAVLRDYGWSSFPGYLRPPTQRRPWLHTRRVLESVGIRADSTQERAHTGPTWRSGGWRPK